MASLQARHRTGCALGARKFTKVGVEGCTCKPSYYAVLGLGAGERKPLGQNLKEAERELHRLEDRRTEGDDPAQKISFHKYADKFLADFTGRASSRKEYETTIEYAKPTIGRAAPKDLRTVKTEHVSAMLKKVREANEGKISDATLSKHLRNLSAVFEAAIGDGYLSRNPVKGLHKTQRPRAVTKKPSYFTDAELAKLWTVLPDTFPANTRTYVYKFALTTGMRIGEIVALRWSDVDLVTGDVGVARSYSERMQKIELPKSGRDRTVDMTADARKVVEAWLEEAVNHGRPTEGDALVFPHPRTGDFLPAANLTRRLYTAMTKAGIPEALPDGRKRNFHSFRHTFARIALERGKVPLDWVTSQLGHSSVLLTKGTYGRWSRDAERKQAKALKGAFKL
jgi:integrase